MLEGFHTCIARSGSDTRLEATVRLDAAHPLFDGHFPGRPVLPGVCQLHILKTLVEEHLRRTVRCVSIREMKFLSPVTPEKENVLQIVLTLTPAADRSVAVQGIIGAGASQKTKIKAIFV